MGGKRVGEGKISKGLRWVRDNWQILLFWLACAFAGWYLGAKGYGAALYFRMVGIDTEEWIPILRLAAEKDPKVGAQISLSGLVDWNGKPITLHREKMTGLLFICGQCGMEEKLAAFHDFSQRHKDKLQMVVVYVGQPSEELFSWMEGFKGLVWGRDPNLTVFERLNVLYMPRFYLVSPDGTLRYISPIVGYLWQLDKWQQELRRVERILGR